MSEPTKDLAPAGKQAMDRPINRTQFKNQGAVKAAARSAMLEALTAFKGGKVGKRGLIVMAMDNLRGALEGQDQERRDWATENVLKMANAIAKDDKSADALAEVLKGAANVQINYNTYWQGRGLTPPPGPGE